MWSAGLVAVVLLGASILPFWHTREGAVVVDVRLNGAGPFKFLVDTGSSHSAISERLAERIGAAPAGRTIVATPNGEQSRAIVRIQALELGGTVAPGVLASVIPPASLPARSFEGLIGQDVLAGLRYTIDFLQRRIEWHDRAIEPAANAVVLALTFDEGRPMVELPQISSVLRLVPDTGAQALVLFDRHACGLSPMPAIAATRRVTTTIGQTPARMMRLPQLHIGSSIARNVEAVVLDEARNEPCTGLLPLHHFERVTFDGPGRQLILEGGGAWL